MKPPGRLYVFEGPDGVGKTTLSKWFAKNLRSQGAGSVIWSSFPGSERGSVGNLVYKLHHNPASIGAKTVHPLSLQLFHVAAHIDAIESRFRKETQNGTTIVLDRFWWSTWVYGRFAGGDDRCHNFRMTFPQPPVFLDETEINARIVADKPVSTDQCSKAMAKRRARWQTFRFVNEDSRDTTVLF